MSNFLDFLITLRKVQTKDNKAKNNNFTNCFAIFSFHSKQKKSCLLIKQTRKVKCIIWCCRSIRSSVF